MKNRYKTKTFRLNDKTIENLEEIKKEEGLSYNLLFWKFIKDYSNKSLKKEIMKIEVKEYDSCPHCGGTIRKKHSKYGEFLACDRFPHCAFKQNIKEHLDVGQAGYKLK